MIGSIICCIIVPILWAVGIIGFVSGAEIMFVIVVPGFMLYCAYRLFGCCSSATNYINNLTDLVKVFEDV